MSSFVDKSWNWTWDGYKCAPKDEVPDEHLGENMILDEAELKARGWYWTRIRPEESNSYTIPDLCKVLNTSKATPMDVLRAVTLLWNRIEDMYPTGSRTMLMYWIENMDPFWDGGAPEDLGLPTSMILLMGFGKPIAKHQIEAWDRFTTQDKDLFMALNSFLEQGEYWIWCPHSTTTLSLASSVSGVMAGPRTPLSVKLGIPFATSHRFKANVLPVCAASRSNCSLGKKSLQL